MVDILYFIIIQVLALALLAITIFIFAVKYFRYQKIKRLYSADYARINHLRSIGSLLPFMPRPMSRRYRETEKLIMDSGLRISVESFYLAKTMMFILGLVFFISIQTTNVFMLFDGIAGDLNIGKTLMDESLEADADTIRLERDIFGYIYTCFPKDKISRSELTDNKNISMYIDYIELQIIGNWTGLRENTRVTAERMYEKLLRIRAIETDYLTYMGAIVAAVFLYFVPNIIANLKLKLIEDKRDWEILNYIYVFSIFGRLPPFNVKNVLSNILVISDIYKPIMSEALNSVKSGKGEGAFDSLLQRVEKEELFELLEAMRLSMSTGLLNIVDNIDEMASNQLKWLEIKSIKRRKTKQVIAMMPVVLIMLVAVVYFSYSLSTLSNPMNFIK